MVKRITFLSIFAFGLILPIIADQTTAGDVKAIVTISGGTELAYNIDQNAIGISNFLRKFGFWIEFVNSSDSYPQYDANYEDDSVQLVFKFVDFKLALNTFQNTGIPSQWEDEAGGQKISYEAQLDGIMAILFWKGFYVGILGSSYYTSPQFDYAATFPGSFRPRYNNEAVLFKNPGLFQPNSADWEVSPNNYAKIPTYYTLKADGSGYDSGPLTGTNLSVNPYSQSSLTSGTFWFGYLSPALNIDFKIGSQKSGLDLISDPLKLNTDNAFNFFASLSTKPFENFYFSTSGLAGINYSEEDTAYGAGAVVSYAIGFSESIYLVPVLGADWVRKWNLALATLADYYEATFGLKFLWDGISSGGRNCFNGQATLKGISTTVIYNNFNNLQLQLAIFEPASNGSLIPFFGFQVFGEIKNLLAEPTIDSGQMLWGAGAYLEYLISEIDLRPYIYGHYKNNTTALNSGQMVIRAGIKYEGIKSVTLELYYLVANLNTDSRNLGNIAFQLRFDY